MNATHATHRSVMILFGAFIVLVLVLLTGANHSAPVGRYRMSVVTRNSFADIYVIDTVTGVVKYLGKDEGKPFGAVEGK